MNITVHVKDVGGVETPITIKSLDDVTIDGKPIQLVRQKEIIAKLREKVSESQGKAAKWLGAQNPGAAQLHAGKKEAYIDSIATILAEKEEGKVNAGDN